MVDDEESVRIDAFARNTLVPVSSQRNTLTGASEENTKTPGTEEAIQAECEFLELRSRENATVKANQGYLDGGTKKEVGELVGQEDLRVV